MAAIAADSEIRMVLEHMLDALNAGDRDRLRSFLAPDAIHIGGLTDDWTTSEELVATLGSEAISFKAVLDDITVYGTTDVAWAVGHAHFENGSRTSRPVRVTEVLARDGDRWTIVHSHASIGVTEEEFFG
jgi:ketosteroid isomerase-like protein